MVQNKQKFININITALITCFMLIIVFVFGCVQYAFASSAKYTIAEIVESCNVEHGAYVGYTYDFSGSTSSSIFSVASSTGKMCAYYYQTDSQIFVGLLSDEPFDAYQFKEFKMKSNWHVNTQDSNGFYGVVSVGSKCNIFEFQTQFLTFSTQEDAVAYLTDGEINNPLFQPSVYDENIPTPANITLTFNCEFGDSFKLEEIGHPFTMTWDNVQSNDNQVNYDDLTFECYVDMGYWAYKDIFGHHDDKTTGKIKLFDSSAMSKYKTCDKLGKDSDWDTWFSNVKLDIKAFGMLGQYYDFYCRYVDSSGNYGNWVKIHVSGSNSTINRKWGVIKDIDASTTINKGYEEIKGNNGEHVSGDYDNYYVGTPDGNLSNNLTSLKNNYSNLVSFYKELFSFLPAEIWIILIGLVSTMVIIAIVKFVRG